MGRLSRAGRYLGLRPATATVASPSGDSAGDDPAGDDSTRWRDGPLDRGLFVNPVGEGADPFVTRDGDRFLWCQSEGNVAIALWESDRLTSLGRRHAIWEAPASGPYAKEVWAPELWQIDERWYVYFAASDGDNRNHRTYVLRSRTSDPLGPYDVHGPLFTGDVAGASTASATGRDVENMWSIDLTLLHHNGRRFAIWSGWPRAGEDLQDLYIARMRSPVEIDGTRVRLLEAGGQLWERTEETADSRGLLEAPQIVTRGSRTFLVYSCAASWLPTYKMGMLELVGADPMDVNHWTRFPNPVFQSEGQTCGVGHGSFVRLANDSWWHVFHAKVDREHGWRRALFAQPMAWRSDGIPDLGVPTQPGEALPVPPDTPDRARSDAQQWDFADPAGDALADFDYYGHHQFIRPSSDGVHLGDEPAAPINAYRTGEKLMVRDGSYADLRVTASLRFMGGHQDAGVLFRTTAPSVGFDAQRGYFAGIVPGRQSLLLGKTNGRAWTELAHVPLPFQTDRSHTLTVIAVGDTIEITAAGEQSNAEVIAHIRHRDGDYPTGSVGLRVVDTHACFASLTIAPILSP